MRTIKLAAFLFLFGLTITPGAVYSDGNIFSKSPVDLALERSDARTRQLLDEIQQRAYYRGAILDYNLLARYTQVPLNVLQAAAEMSGKEGAERNAFVIGFAEAVGQYLAEGKDVRGAVYAVLPDRPKAADELLQRAINNRVKPHTSDDTIKLNADNNGHFWGTARIDGTEVTMLVDTGASYILLR
jgi:hypothetical protein